MDRHSPPTVTSGRPDPRPVWRRVLVWSGMAVLAAVSLPVLLIGVVDADDPEGKFLLCFGLVLLVGAVGGVAREVAERRITHDPPQPRLDRLPDGEQALLLPRAVAPTLISSWVFFGFGGVLVLGTLFAALERSWGVAVVVACCALGMLLTAVPHRAARMAGGLWLTPTRVVDDYRGARWELPWESATGVDAHHPLRVLLAVRPDRVPTVQRTGPRGRAWNPVVAGNVLRVDSAHLAGGSALLGDLVTRALADPAVRRSLGTPASVPTR